MPKEDLEEVMKKIADEITLLSIEHISHHVNEWVDSYPIDKASLSLEIFEKIKDLLAK